MSIDLPRLQAARDRAKARLEDNFGHVREEITPRNLGERIADRVTHDARETYDQALDVAKESKGIIALTLGALALWLLRNPILTFIDQQLSHDSAPDVEHDEQDGG